MGRGLKMHKSNLFFKFRSRWETAKAPYISIWGIAVYKNQNQLYCPSYAFKKEIYTHACKTYAHINDDDEYLYVYEQHTQFIACKQLFAINCTFTDCSCLISTVFSSLISSEIFIIVHILSLQFRLWVEIQIKCQFSFFPSQQIR